MNFPAGMFDLGNRELKRNGNVNNLYEGVNVRQDGDNYGKTGGLAENTIIESETIQEELLKKE